MTRVRVRWEEVTTYDQVFEIPDFNPGNDYQFQDKITDAIVEQANFMHVDEVAEREILDWQVIPE